MLQQGRVVYAGVGCHDVLKLCMKALPLAVEHAPHGLQQLSPPVDFTVHLHTSYKRLGLYNGVCVDANSAAELGLIGSVTLGSRSAILQRSSLSDSTVSCKARLSLCQDGGGASSEPG